MAWPNPFRRRDANTRTSWGYTFQWTEEHLSPTQMHPLKFSYDTLGEECLERLNKISPPPRSALPRNSNKYVEKDQETYRDAKKEDLPSPPKRDLYALLRDNAESDEKLSQLWQEVNTIPDWVDWDQIDRGQQVFYRYGGAALTGLAYQSLLGGMGAQRVVETLARTGGFSTKVARGRMYETTQHILQCTNSLDSIKPGGAGHASSLRVRLLHAAVRQRIMKLAQQRPDYYNIEEWGVPINDLDCIATIGTFSATLIWLSFPRQGIWLREQEVKDYVALWRLVAHYVGTPTKFFETPESARAVMESLLVSEINPTETSKVLANNIIRSLEAQPPTYASRDFLFANARWLNGNELADSLGLGNPNMYYWALVAGQCLFFMGLCYFYRAIPYLDKKKIAALREIFYAVIVKHKTGLGEETNFEFKYIPEFHTTTELGEAQEVVGLKQPGVERRNLKTLVIAIGVFSVASYCGLRVFSGVIRKILG
ncbi:MAG: hypothetical protein M1827_005013 [Pycnora praestabilis]|nr:MAG: hypothetical protein M1827_005013 [Pycnora praestabilis]